MKLDAWIKAKGLTDKEFGERIRRSQSSVTRIRRGDTKPDWETAKRIAEATSGEVMPNDFLPERPEAAE